MKDAIAVLENIKMLAVGNIGIATAVYIKPKKRMIKGFGKGVWFSSANP